MLQKIKVVLCDDGWLCKACPEIHVDDGSKASQQVRITDDFGQKVSMSREQFRVLVQKAKSGELDAI